MPYWPEHSKGHLPLCSSSIPPHTMMVAQSTVYSAHTHIFYKASTDNANVMCALHCKWVCRRWCNSGGVDATLLPLRLHRALQHCFTATILDHWLGLCAALLHPNPTGNVGKSHKNVNRPSSPRPSSHLLEQRLLQLGIAKMCFFFHICLTHKGFHPKNRHFK